jgi:hypothetical protein
VIHSKLDRTHNVFHAMAACHHLEGTSATPRST